MKFKLNSIRRFHLKYILPRDDYAQASEHFNSLKSDLNKFLESAGYTFATDVEETKAPFELKISLVLELYDYVSWLGQRNMFDTIVLV